jgi:hypothetical protein
MMLEVGTICWRFGKLVRGLHAAAPWYTQHLESFAGLGSRILLARVTL